MSTYIVGEIGINHNGHLDIAHRLMVEAADAGFDAVKFQKRDPDVSVPPDQKDVVRQTPWGTMRYIDYKQYIEFWFNEYNQIEQWAQELGLEWGVSVWDVESSRFMEQFPADFIKIPSAHITNHTLLREVKWAHKDKVIMMSTGMSEMIEVEEAIRILQPDVVYHCNSQYPCPVNEINLTAMFTLADLQWDLEVYYDVGYSGHETGLATTIAAVALGAKYIERHITLDRSSWGTDQSASVEPVGMRRLVRDIRSVEKAMGNGMIECTNGEKPIRRKLRGY